LRILASRFSGGRLACSIFTTPKLNKNTTTMKAKTHKLTPQQKAQVLGDSTPLPADLRLRWGKHHQQIQPKMKNKKTHPIDALLSTLAACKESGPLTVPLSAISRDVKVLNTLFKRAKEDGRPVGTGVTVLRVTLN
jgi:hypothetical protein